MNTKSLKNAVVAFHLTLGGVVFLQGLGVVLRAHSGGVVDALKSHVIILAVAEALSALLFLFPKTTRVGGGMLLVIFAIAVFIHGIRSELTLLVYAAGVVLVMIQGGGYKIG
jgi:hypothetical protein